MASSRIGSLTLLLLLLGLFSYMAVAANAASETFTIPAGQTATRTVGLKVDDEVSGRVTVVGSGESNEVGFTVLGPAGSLVLPSTTVVASNFNFKAAEEGTYSFEFDNSQSTEDKSVSLNYDVQHYWFGMPQEFVLMLIVVFLGVLGLVIYAMVSKR